MRHKLILMGVALGIGINMMSVNVYGAEVNSAETVTEQVEESVYQLSHGGILQEGYLAEEFGERNVTDAMAVAEIYEAVKNYETVIELSEYQISIDAIDGIISQVLNEHPELFYVTFNECTSENGVVKSLTPTYQTEQETLLLQADAYQQAINKALSNIDSRMNDLEKALVLHNWLVSNCVYGSNSDNPQAAYTAYGALVEGKAVCQGITLAYQELLKQAGIESSYVSSQSMNHAWNLVKIDGQWYHVDVTWDDKWEQSYSYTYDHYKDNNRIVYTWFMLSDSGMQAASHSNWSASYAATSTRFDNAFWHDAADNSTNGFGIYYLDGAWYYKEIFGGYKYSLRINKITGGLENGTHSVLLEETDWWRYEDGSSGSASYEVSFYEGALYYNTQYKVYRYTGSGSPELFYESDVSLFGLIIRDGALQACLTDPYEAEDGYEYVTLISPSNPTTPQQTFVDVPSDAYYATPVNWAVQKGITNGTGDSTFSPAGDCTRGQIVTFLWRAAGSPEPSSANNPFTDVSTSSYYYKAVLWAVEKGITTGTSGNTFSPNATCTRAQAVTFLYRYAGQPSVASASNPFGDVSSGAYYYNPVLWAVKQGITTGTSATAFSPEAYCTRGQIVTFLYRQAN